MNLKAEYDPLDFVADGMTIDTEGNLYVATFFGGRILKINPSGKIEKEIQIPTSQVRFLTRFSQLLSLMLPFISLLETLQLF